MNVDEWLSSLTEGASLRDIASRVKASKSTLSRQLEKGVFRPEMVIALCRGYDRSPVTGLIETGYIEPWETEGVAIPYALEQATNQQILDEINRRSDPEARYLFTNDNDPDIVDIVEDAQVYELHPTRTDPDTIPEDAVADSSPDEDRLREELEGDWTNPENIP